MSNFAIFKILLMGKKPHSLWGKARVYCSIIQSLSTHQELMPSWVGCERLLTPLPGAPGKPLRAPTFALWCKASLTQGAQISLLPLLQLLAPLHPAHLHCGCSRTTSCWQLSQYIFHSPSPNLLLFGQTFPFCCFTEAVLYNSVWPTASRYRGLLQAVSPSHARSWHAIIRRKSTVKSWSDPGRDTWAHDFSWYIKHIAGVPFWARVHTAIWGDHQAYV